MANIYESYDNFLNVDSISPVFSITSDNSDAIISSGSIDSSKIKNLVLDTLEISWAWYIKSWKESFDDSTNSWWYLNISWLYVWAESDTSYLKYTTSTWELDFVGKVKATSGSIVSWEYLVNWTVVSEKVKPSMRGSSHDISFSSVDSDSITWSDWTIVLSDWTSYTISSWALNSIVSRTFIYLDIETSVTTLQTSTTLSDSIWEEKILIWSAINGDDWALFSVVWGSWWVNIDANSIVVNNLSALSADIWDITSWTITIDDSWYIRWWQTDFNNGNGWFIGYSSNNYKMSIGNDSNYLTWDGAHLRIKGNLELSSVFNNKDYTLATLPYGTSSTSFNNPSGIE